MGDSKDGKRPAGPHAQNAKKTLKNSNDGFLYPKRARKAHENMSREARSLSIPSP